MANHETHSVIAGGIESDLHIDSSKYPHPFCSLLQKRAHFDSFKHLIFIRGLLAIAHGKRKNKISASMVSFYVSLVQVMCAHYIPDTNKVNLSVKELSVCSGGSYTRVWRALKTLDNDLHLIAFDGGTIWFRPDMFETLRVGPDELVTARRRGIVLEGDMCVLP
ncbi:putative replication protein RepA [Escherichia coli]|uniref:Putative replication protein RepA n=1 Tax=Escherichia coli TaxID=562 RepID=A0A376ZUC8_ECOLX|nr:putative replication protein RepA [Escherichia coli]